MWQQTVMSPEQLEAIIQERFPIFELNEEDEEEREATIEEIAKAQAEISYKAGMKEVVEWVEANHGNLGTEEQPVLTINNLKWQAFLKEIET